MAVTMDLEKEFSFLSLLNLKVFLFIIVNHILGNWEYEIVDGLEIDEFSKGKIKITEDELLAE